MVRSVRREHAHGLRNLARCLLCEFAVVSVSCFSCEGVVTGEEMADCRGELSEAILVGESSRVSMLRLRLSPLVSSDCVFSLLCFPMLKSMIFSA